MKILINDSSMFLQDNLNLHVMPFATSMRNHQWTNGCA